MEGTGAEWRPSIGQSEPKVWQQRARDGRMQHNRFDRYSADDLSSSPFRRLIATAEERSGPASLESHRTVEESRLLR